VALAIWALSCGSCARAVPPAPLRPLLAIHLAPAALFATVAGLLARHGSALPWFSGLGMVL
jgi:tellurite resistance protein